MTHTDDYILGTQHDELRRLESQHQTWLQQAYELFARAPLKTGERLLDLGAGPGFTSLELARLVGPGGRVLACDLSEPFLRHLEGIAARDGLTQLAVQIGLVEEIEFEAGAWDGAYARWFFCWLHDPLRVLERVARALRPGGRILIQDYFDWGRMRLMPHSPAFATAVEACMQSWHAAGGTIDIVQRLPELAPAAGLVVDELRPIPRTGRPGSLVWRWMRDFFHGYLPKLVAAGGLTPEAADACLADLVERERTTETWFYAPVVADVILRKP